MKNITNKALEYVHKYNFSVIPVRPDKLPYIRWVEFQKYIAPDEQIIHWFENRYPKAMIGVVTGKISNLTVIDIDTKEGEFNIRDILPSEFKAPTVKTPGGGKHLYCKYKIGLRNNTRAIPGTDLRSQGGYVVAPPSMNELARRYKWVNEYNLDKIPIPELPDIYVQTIAQGKKSFNPRQLTDDCLIEGRRDEDLFHIATTLIRGGMGLIEVKIVLRKIASICEPPFSKKEADIKAESAFARYMKSDSITMGEIRQLLSTYEGIFSLNELRNDLGVRSKKDRDMIYVAVQRLSREGTIEKYGNKNGIYRIVEGEATKMEFGKTAKKTVDIKLPLEVDELVTIYPGNIIVIAGTINAGKTAWLLNFVKMNMNNFEVHYFNSESGVEEFEDRLLLFNDTSLDDWNFTVWERSSNFADLIKPNAINVIDYVEIYDSFWKIGAIIKEIHDKLDKGLAIIALQKSRGKYLGRGMEFSGEKPRLYLSVENGRMTIVKAKNWKTGENPNGLFRDFKLVNGSEFIPMGFWRRD